MQISKVSDKCKQTTSEEEKNKLNIKLKHTKFKMIFFLPLETLKKLFTVDSASGAMFILFHSSELFIFCIFYANYTGRQASGQTECKNCGVKIWQGKMRKIFFSTLSLLLFLFLSHSLFKSSHQTAMMVK